MAYNNIRRLYDQLGPDLQQLPEVQAMVTALSLDPNNPDLVDGVGKMLQSLIFKESGNTAEPSTFPIVKTLPPGDAPIGTVINGDFDGPRFELPEGTSSDLQNVGLFGPPRQGKTYIMKSIALDTMRRGNAAWIFDVEDEFSGLVEAVDEPYKPIIITPEHLRINFFQPPGEGITVKRWRENVAAILRSEMFIRDGAQNLFNKTIDVLLKKKEGEEDEFDWVSVFERP